MLGENPGSSGYTFHRVSPELDGGSTLFAQLVPLPELDASIMDSDQRECYIDKHEEILRLNTMRAQQKYAARVLEVLCSGTEKKVVYDEEAFEAEGRLRPENCPEKYSRVLFDNKGKWQTLEQRFEALASANREDIATQRTYRFFVPTQTIADTSILGTLYEEAHRFGAERGMINRMRSAKQTGGYYVEIETVHPEFHEYLWKKGYGDYEVDDMPVGVTAPRKANPNRRGELPDFTRIVLP